MPRAVSVTKVCHPRETTLSEHYLTWGRALRQLLIPLAILSYVKTEKKKGGGILKCF